MNREQTKAFVLTNTISTAFEFVDSDRTRDQFLSWSAQGHDPTKLVFSLQALQSFAAAAYDRALTLKNGPPRKWRKICDHFTDGNLDDQEALDTHTIECQILIEGLSLAIIDGVKVSFDTDPNDFHNASICPSISHDIVFLDEWIVRSVPSKQDAFHQARTNVAAKLYGFSLFHFDPEGFTGLLPNPIHQLPHDAQTLIGRPCSNRFSKADDQDQAAVLELIRHAETLHPWSDAIHFNGLTEPELRAMIRTR